MRLTPRVGLIVVALLAGGFLLYQVYPTLLFKVSEWQRSFNLALSGALNSLKSESQQAGLTLVGVSFLYGVFHAVGPGHGKFVLTGYLAFEPTKLPQAIRLTLLSAFVQGVVAVALVTVIVVLFTLSRSYFNVTLQWVERGGFLMMLLLGVYWIYQGKQVLFPVRKRVKIKQIVQNSALNRPLVGAEMQGCHHHSADCGCGHKHLPNSTELEQASSWQAQWMLVLSIGLRPCTGAVLVLFLAYTLELYLWGVLAAMVMALGTGLTLTLFACLVLLARQKAVNLGKWYLSLPSGQKLAQWLKLFTGILMLILAITLLHSSWLEVTPSLLFKR